MIDSINRRDLETAAAPLFPSPWSASLAASLGWNPRTVERLGTPRMPLDARRAAIAVKCLERADVHTAAAHALAAWLRAKFGI